MELQQLEDKRTLIVKLALKYCYNEKHALMTETVALMLFDVLKLYHKFGNNERLLLSHSCLLHDIGAFINYGKHNRHSKYLIEKDELLDTYPEKERQLLALITFNHRKKLHKSTMLLEKEEKNIVLKLSALIRLADSLSEVDGALGVKSMKIKSSELVININKQYFDQIEKRVNSKNALFINIFNLDILLRQDS